MQNKFDAVLFDMDGTVLDTVDDLWDAACYAITRHGQPPCTRQQAIDATGNGAAELVAGCLPQGYDTPDFDQILADYRAYYAAHTADKTRPYEGIVALLEELQSRGVRVAIVSNKPDGAVKDLAERFFPGVFAMGEQEGTARKPAPDMIYHVLNMMGVEKDRALYVGDSEVDIWTTQNADMRLAAVSYGFRTRERLISEGAETICDTVAELRDYLL